MAAIPDGSLGPVAELGVGDITVGQTVSIVVTVEERDLDRFAALTGDISPIHMDAEFARSRGFCGRVVHGLLLGGYVSRLFGVHLPGRDCLLQSISLKWLAPVCAGDQIQISATVSQVSWEARAMTAEVMIVDRQVGTVRARGKVQAGFTGMPP